MPSIPAAICCLRGSLSKDRRGWKRLRSILKKLLGEALERTDWAAREERMVSSFMVEGGREVWREGGRESWEGGLDGRICVLSGGAE